MTPPSPSWQFSADEFLAAPEQYTIRLLKRLPGLSLEERNHCIVRWSASVARLGVAVDLFAFQCAQYVEGHICADMGISSMQAWAQKIGAGHELVLMYADASQRYYDRKKPLYERIGKQWGKEIEQHPLLYQAVHQTLDDLARIAENKRRYTWNQVLEHLRCSVFIRIQEEYWLSEEKGTRFGGWTESSLLPTRQDFNRICRRNKTGIKLHSPSESPPTTEDLKNTFPGRPLKVTPDGLLTDDSTAKQNLSTLTRRPATTSKAVPSNPALQVALEANSRLQEHKFASATALPPKSLSQVEATGNNQQPATPRASTRRHDAYQTPEDTPIPSRKRGPQSAGPDEPSRAAANKKVQLATPTSNARERGSTSVRRRSPPVPLLERHAANTLLDQVHKTRPETAAAAPQIRDAGTSQKGGERHAETNKPLHESASAFMTSRRSDRARTHANRSALQLVHEQIGECSISVAEVEDAGEEPTSYNVSHKDFGSSLDSRNLKQSISPGLAARSLPLSEQASSEVAIAELLRSPQVPGQWSQPPDPPATEAAVSQSSSEEAPSKPTPTDDTLQTEQGSTPLDALAQAGIYHHILGNCETVAYNIPPFSTAYENLRNAVGDGQSSAALECKLRIVYDALNGLQKSIAMALEITKPVVERQSESS